MSGETIIECITDIEKEMYEIVCRIPDQITDGEMFGALESALGNKRGE